ncbi:hypothetical protein TRFO_05624 [Tritrichomonas foetus]|uniref:EF-hand domain-containing protein n=1 Tax=Tritrichomonas foetus TaxID=1144522 RepID=A0A1J4KAD2_9EUKA|nr:hypothetical protein TRFO_05624 [Tritrichomonas foetus]|eukprot:OHT06413.1 hypothetical protein TRFO_05624 [Tritrichomonas foetus]
MKALEFNNTKEKVRRMINDVNEDGTGAINFAQLLQIMAKKVEERNLEDETRNPFSIFDD